MSDSLFTDVGADGYVHTVSLDGAGEVGEGSDDLVVTASVFKIPIMLEVAARFDSGEIAPTERVTVTPAQRVIGPTGVSMMRDEIEVSVRDLAYLMMSVSDNTATDVLLDMVGLDAVNARLRKLGLDRTELVGDCGDIIGTLVADAAIGEGEALETISPERLLRCRCLVPELTTRTTPREMCELLRLIWADEAAQPQACAEVRRIMGMQVWPHRLRSAFPATVRIAAKTGTLVTWRNEAGVISYPDGQRYAVAVFTRAHTVEDPQPAIDAAIGSAAREAIAHLRPDEGRSDMHGRA